LKYLAAKTKVFVKMLGKLLGKLTIFFSLFFWFYHQQEREFFL